MIEVTVGEEDRGLGIASGDTIVDPNGSSFDVIENRGSGKFLVEPWPWWKYIWVPVRRVLVRSHCKLSRM